MVEPSICIPLVSSRISKESIRFIFEKIQFGKIRRIDAIRKNNFKTIFVHFYYWYNNKNATIYKKKLLNEETLFITSMTKPLFLKCVLNKAHSF